MGPLILGHRPPEVMVAVKQVLDDIEIHVGLEHGD